jgi:uncharacterized protein YcfJ
MTTNPLVVALIVGGLAQSACSTAPERPVFYPNAHIKKVGKAQARRDTDACIAEALNYGVNEKKDGKPGQKTVEGAAIGGAAAGAWGLVRGNAGERAAAGALAGGAVGATRGTIESTRTSPIHKRFVRRCLTDRGYDVIGWQ